MRNLTEGFVDVKSSLRGGKWTAFNLWAEGRKIVLEFGLKISLMAFQQEENCRRCPTTTSLLEEHVPLVRDCALGFVYFSVLTPGTHILPHCGPSNIRLRTLCSSCLRLIYLRTQEGISVWTSHRNARCALGRRQESGERESVCYLTIASTMRCSTRATVSASYY